MPGQYRVLPVLVLNSPSSCSSSLSFLPCPHRVLTVCMPPPLKYVMLLWSMYCCSEICIAALKYVLRLWKMYCCTKIYIATPKYVIQTACTCSQASLCSTIWAPPHDRVHSGLVPAPRPLTVLILGSHLVNSFELAQNFRRLSPRLAGRQRATNVFTDRSTPRRVPPPCSTVRTKFTTRWHTVGLAGTSDVTATLDTPLFWVMPVPSLVCRGTPPQGGTSISFGRGGGCQNLQHQPPSPRICHWLVYGTNWQVLRECQISQSPRHYVCKWI